MIHIQGGRGHVAGGRVLWDEQDEEILDARQKARLKLRGPRVGDYIYMLDGSFRRFTHAWSSGLQVTCDKWGGSFYLQESGHLDYSGALDPIVKHAAIEFTGDTKLGPCWFFHHDYHRAHNGVDTYVLCRVYRQVQP